MPLPTTAMLRVATLSKNSPRPGDRATGHRSAGTTCPRTRTRSMTKINPTAPDLWKGSTFPLA
eukprot:9670840-Lingulodinium_polyedra.AAC.1